MTCPSQHLLVAATQHCWALGPACLWLHMRLAAATGKLLHWCCGVLAATRTVKAAAAEPSGGSALRRYTADETPMASYINIHKMVNNRRLEAQQRAEEGEAVVGPRVIVVGPTDAGKSTLCRLLINYAVRSGFEPTFVDLDVGEAREGRM